MNLNEIKNTLKSAEYDFLRTNKHLGNNIILLTLGGSHAYGTNREDSDIDIRGIALNSKQEILLGKDFENIVDTPTDTTIYSLNKMLDLLSKCNPNTIECLGCKPEQYLHLTKIGEEIIANRKMFLSQLCIHTFGGYSSAQLRRMENKSGRTAGQDQREKYILRSICNAMYDFKNRYFPYNDSQIKLYIDDAILPDMDKEIYINCNLMHYPLRDWCGMWNEMKTIVSSYNKIGKRNQKAIEHDKLGKHCEHLIRLFMMVVDILEKEEIITYRENEHDLLMSIRNGEYLDKDQQPTPEFYALVDEWEKRFEYAKKNTSLPKLPDYKRINEFKMYVNEMIVKGEI